jgi:hypothetical protein
LKPTLAHSLFAPLTVLTFAGSCLAGEFRLKDGDRVIWIGNTLIEREQRYGFWETALTIAFPKENVQFRNLGWSGDTVWGEARAGFETAKEGYQRLIEKTLAQKPTVIMIGYGTNESFAGKAGLQRFEEQFNRFLDDLKPSKARLVLLAPLMFEKERWRAANFGDRTRDLKLYTEAVHQLARKRQALFVADLHYSAALPLTDDGIHLTGFGYWWTTFSLLNELGLGNRGGRPVELEGITAKRVLQDCLINPPNPEGNFGGDHQADSRVIAHQLNSGSYTLKIDGQPLLTADAQKWLKPEWPWTIILKGPSLDQAEKLRKVIVEKNRLYFNRWRPQNETYLYGFRKAEQGDNAVEIPEFDPLIEKLEKEIARLRKPVAHIYQLVPAEGRKK